MSRTDKDMPYWVTGGWEPEHSNACRAGTERCTLSERPWKQHPCWRLYSGWSCHWSPAGGYRRRSAGGWFISAAWSGPDRMTVRDAGRRAVSEHRATGQVDIELPTRQHRHGALWDVN